MSSLLVVYATWGPVAWSWYLMTYKNIEAAEKWFFYSTLISLIGPLVGYSIPLVILILAYNRREDSGLLLSSKVHFWLGWFLGVFITLLSIFFEFAFLPGVRTWWEAKNFELETPEEEVVEEDTNDTSTEDENTEPEPIPVEEVSDSTTAFFDSDFGLDFLLVRF